MSRKRAKHKDLDKAVDAFAAAMKAKLYAKLHEGWQGWTKRIYIPHFREQLRRHRLRGDPVDVANYAMFLWNLDESTHRGVGER